ncbi:MAG: 50S ribosomal protein L4 [Hyphomicrobiales bacterium]|nr:50S ribosomal protein L4 [Hyphomicrobiales bacterium]
MKLDVTSLDAKSAGSIELPDEVFGLEPRVDILHRMVRYQLLKRQAGTHYAKGRSEVIGTNKKIYKQKGTGQARHANKKAPQFRGGGKAFGPQPRSHAIDLPKKVRALALRHALSAKVKAFELIILDKAEIAEPKTGALRAQFEGMGLSSALIIGGTELQENFALAARNIPNVDVLPVQGINVYDILRRDKLVLTKAAVEALEERFK